jgi:hypothetical protein
MVGPKLVLDQMAALVLKIMVGSLCACVKAYIFFAMSIFL